MSTALTGTRPLLRVSLRQDARNIAPWVGLISLLSATSILAYAWIFNSTHERKTLSATLGANPALSLVFGPARDLMTADGFNAWRAGQLGAMFAGLMAILIVVRNSRANEDSGQAELIASAVIARQSRLAVAVAMAWLASLALGVVCFLITVACGGGALPTLILAASFAASGMMFAGVAAVCAQLGSDARTASSIAIALLGVGYVLRGYIDSSNTSPWVDWLTPFGWLERARPATENNPWPLAVAVVFALLLATLAFLLQAGRDFGQGLLSPRPGPAVGRSAGTVFGAILGLVLRLNRTSLISWMIAFAGLGLVFGNLATSIGDILANNPAAAQILASGAAGSSDLTFAFITTILQIVAIIVAVAGVQIVLRLYSEEIDYRVEPLLAGSLRRQTNLASHALVAFAATLLCELLAGVGIGAVASSKTHAITFSDVLGQACVTVPGIWTLIALALAAVGAVPALRLAAWLGVVATFGLTLLGPTFKLPGWALGISPLHHVPTVTAASPEWSGLLWLAVAIALFLTVAFAGYRRRDIV